MISEQWEYLDYEIISPKGGLIEMLNAMGQDGWEVVCPLKEINPVFRSGRFKFNFLLKRKIQKTDVY